MKESHQSPRPLSLRLFLVSLVMSGAAGQGVWLTPLSADPIPAPGFSWGRVFSRREGVLLSLGSGSTAPLTGPSTPPSSSGNKLRQREQRFQYLKVVFPEQKLTLTLTMLIFICKYENMMAFCQSTCCWLCEVRSAGAGRRQRRPCCLSVEQTEVKCPSLTLVHADAAESGMRFQACPGTWLWMLRRSRQGSGLLWETRGGAGGESP